MKFANLVTLSYLILNLFSLNAGAQSADGSMSVSVGGSSRTAQSGPSVFNQDSKKLFELPKGVIIKIPNINVEIPVGDDVSLGKFNIDDDTYAFCSIKRIFKSNIPDEIQNQNLLVQGDLELNVDSFDRGDNDEYYDLDPKNDQSTLTNRKGRHTVPLTLTCYSNDKITLGVLKIYLSKINGTVQVPRALSL